MRVTMCRGTAERPFLTAILLLTVRQLSDAGKQEAAGYIVAIFPQEEKHGR